MSIKNTLKEGQNIKEFLSDVNDSEVIQRIESSLGGLIEQPMTFDQEMNVLIVAEDWCIDCLVNLPILKQLILNSEQVTYGIIDKETYKAIVDHDERLFIPLVIFYDQRFNEIGRWVETPYEMKEIRQLEDQAKIKEAMKDYRKGTYIEKTIEELQKIVMPISK